MKKILWGLLVWMLLILVTQQLTASGKTEEPVPQGMYRFYYYPTSNFYYDVAKGNFVYTLDGGRSWEVQGAASPQTAKAFNDREVIDIPVPEVWKYNPDHRRKYGGLLTDYREGGRASAAAPAPIEKKEAHSVKKEKKNKDRSGERKEKAKEEKKREEGDKDKSEGRLKNFTKGLKEKFRKLGKED